MTGAINLLVGAAMGLNLLALASSRLPSIIQAAALQGVVLGVLSLLVEPEFHWVTLLVALATILIKGLVIPQLLRRALRTANIEREVEPLVGFVPSLLLGAGAALAAILLADALPMHGGQRGTLLAPGAFATVVTGLLLLMSRTKAITQVCGYLLLENGIYLFGLLLLGHVSLIVEAGILLDLTVAVFVIGIIVDRIQREFDSLDTRKLTSLRE